MRLCEAESDKRKQKAKTLVIDWWLYSWNHRLQSLTLQQRTSRCQTLKTRSSAFLTDTKNQVVILTIWKQIEIEILNLLERTTALTPTELEYLERIENKRTRWQVSLKTPSSAFLSGEVLAIVLFRIDRRYGFNWKPVEKFSKDLKTWVLSCKIVNVFWGTPTAK